jgi:hypothetical protein
MTSNKNYFNLLSIAFLLVIISMTNISDSKKVKTLGVIPPKGSSNKNKKRNPNATGLADGQRYGFKSSCGSIELDLTTFVLEAECKGKKASYSKISTLDLTLCFKTISGGINKTFEQNISNPGFSHTVKDGSCKLEETIFSCEMKQKPGMFFSIDLDRQIGNLDGIMNLNYCKAKFVEQINN